MARPLGKETKNDHVDLDKRLELALRQSRDHLGGSDNGTVTRVHAVDRSEITAIRLKSGLSQDTFARRIGISVATLRNWEQGRRAPSGPARKLLEIIDRRPDVILDPQTAE